MHAFSNFQISQHSLFCITWFSSGQHRHRQHANLWLTQNTSCMFCFEILSLLLFNFFVNEVYDELYSNTAVYLDVEDVVNAVGDLFSVESADQIFAFTSANKF